MYYYQTSYEPSNNKVWRTKTYIKFDNYNVIGKGWVRIGVANELDEASEADCVFLPLEDDFPCADRFASAAALYLAAMLIIDENIELSDKLFDRYCDIMATIHSEIPAKIEKIAQKYGAY